MKKWINLWVGPTLLFLSSFANADLTASKHLVERLSGMHAFQADFIQTVMDGRGTMLQTTSGEMAVQRPGQFYWQAHPPLEQLVVSDGEQLWSNPQINPFLYEKMD